jgi:hypothetical protein
VLSLKDPLLPAVGVEQDSEVPFQEQDPEGYHAATLATKEPSLPKQAKTGPWCVVCATILYIFANVQLVLHCIISHCANALPAAVVIIDSLWL